MGIKVLVADDQEIIRRGVRSLLTEDPEIELVGEATSFAETVQMVERLTPQVVVLDLHMKDEVKLTSLEIKSHLNINALVIAMSLWNDSETKQLAESLGAVTLLDKAELVSTLVPTIKQFASRDSRILT
jgi:DNA-binding NarL/FixJ family response regulator